MNIKSIVLEYAHKSGFDSLTSNGVRHTKILPYLSIVQAVVGNYDIQLGNGKVYNTGNSGFFIAPSGIQQTIVHNADKNCKMVCRWVFLKIKLNNLYDFDELFLSPIVVPESHKSKLNQIFNRLFSTEDPFIEHTLYYQIIEILSEISKRKEHKVFSNISNALNYIKINYRNKITVETLAKTVNISKSNFFTVFKKATGISPITYLNKYRMSIAIELILNTNKTFTEIAADVGIFDVIYFNKLFKKYFQMSPSMYREIYRNSNKIINQGEFYENS